MEVDMVLGIQLIGMLFGLFVIYLTFIYYKKRNLNAFELIGWLAVWMGFLFLVLFPHIIDSIIKELNIVRAMDLFMVSAIMLLLGLVFYLYIVVRNNERRVEKIVREIALKEIKKK